MYYRIIPFSRTFDTFGLIYKIPKNLISHVYPGKLVEIPLRNSSELWILFSETSVENIDYKLEDIREVMSVIHDFVFLSDWQLGVINYISNHYITPIHNPLTLYFPRNLLEKIHKDKFDKLSPKSYSYLDSASFTLSEKQQEIYKTIENWKTWWKFLLYGITGSGKTEIYMKLIAETLKLWKQTLLLIPEIILTSQIGERVQKVFWNDVLILHSGVSAAKKSQYWIDIHSWNAKIIIGTRSALFYPYNNLETIIIDEEHDPSYISENAPRYHTLEVAEYISKLTWAWLLAASGTPRVTTFYRGLKWDFQVLQLLDKYSENEEKI